MGKQKTLFFVGAHPDDETFGIGGTLACYAAKGVKVYYLCGTRGEVGVADPEFMEGFETPGDMRWSELECASRELGLAGVFHLGYRDSGMPGSEDNNHPDALTSAPVEVVAGRVVKYIRELKPEVIITSDPIGGYRHPDHIAMHNAAVMAFRSAGDANAYPEAGEPYSPQKLYFVVMPRKLLRFFLRLLPLFGQDPRHMGRNRDIDMLSMTSVDFPVHASIKLTKEALEARTTATACYRSQLRGAPRRRGILGFIQRISGRNDLFMREYPKVNSRRREKDLFEGVN